MNIVAKCARYEEALTEIAKGDEDPTILALLAYAALHNQPPVTTAVESEINKLQEAISLLHSMVLSGESHSPESLKIVREALAR